MTLLPDPDAKRAKRTLFMAQRQGETKNKPQNSALKIRKLAIFTYKSRKLKTLNK